jgi:hypothetical protein
MTMKTVRALIVPAIALGCVIASGCGGGGGGRADTDAGDPPIDVPTEGEDAPDVPEDTEMDGDAEDPIEEDAEDEEVVTHTTGTPFSVETAGGAKLTGTSYVLELFVAPVRPVGNVSSTSYDLQLGPAGLRHH